VVKYLPTNAGDTGYTGLIPVQEDTLKKEMTNQSSILAQEIPRQRSMVGYSLWAHKRVGHD